MEKIVNKTDAELIEFMKTSKTIEEWNSNRDMVKRVRDTNWVTKHLDSSKLVIQVLGKDDSKVILKKRQEVTEEVTEDEILTD